MTEPATYQGLPWRSGSADPVWAAAAHGGGLLLSFVPALVILMIKGRRSGLVRQHGFEALNFHLTILILYVITVALIIVVIGLVLTFALWITSVVLMATAAVRAWHGRPYRYPFALRMFH